MAKKNDAAFDAFLADIKTLAPGIEEILKDERVSTKLRESVLARADYSANMDDLKAQREAFASEVQQARTKIDGWTKWYGEESKTFATAQDELKAYRDEYGELNDSGKRREAAKVGLTAEEFEKKLSEEIQRRDVASIKFADALTDIKIEHRQRFGERLDTEEVFKIAGEKSLPLDVAYDVFIADRVKEETKTKQDEAIKLAREEGAREALAKHHLPIIDSRSDMVHTLDVKDVSKNSNDRINAAVSAFMGRK